MLNKYLAGVVQLSDQAERNANCDQRADSANSIGDEDTTVLMQFLLSIDDVSDLPLTE